MSLSICFFFMSPMKNENIRSLTLVSHVGVSDEGKNSESENTLNSFSTIVRKAQELGYTEPNPKDDLNGIKSSYYMSKIVRSGIRIILLGKPNVGKSSIYNCLLGYNRSIIANRPGTTRDTIESTIENSQNYFYALKLNNGENPMRGTSAAPLLGEDNESIFCDRLKLPKDRLEQLKTTGIV